MGVLSRTFGLSMKALGRDPSDDFWYSGAGGVMVSQSGMTLTAENAMKVSAVFGSVRILSSISAMLPAILFEVFPDGSKDRARSHPLYSLLRIKPNNQQTSFGWRQQKMVHLLLRGNAYDQIVPGRRGFADQLVPFHPDRILPEYNPGTGNWIPARNAAMTPNGKMRYVRLMGMDGQDSPQIFQEEDVHHTMGMSSNGLMGVSVIQMMRDSVGLAMATEAFGSRFFSQMARPGGVLQTDGSITDEQFVRIKKEWQEAHAGVANSHKVAILEAGLKWQPIGLTAQDSQFLQLRNFQVEDIIRFLGVPGLLLGHNDRGRTYTSEEQFGISLATYTLQPWLELIEQSVAKDLILDNERYYLSILMDGLMRGDSAARWSTYQIGRSIGVYSPNEVRLLENMNPFEGGDTRSTSVPGAPAPPTPGAPKPPAPPGKPADGTDREEDGEDPDDPAIEETAPDAPQTSSTGRMLSIVQQAAARLVRKEVATIKKWAPRYASNPAAWSAWVGRFYQGHAQLVAETLQITPDGAADYVSAQRAELLAAGVRAIEGWEASRRFSLVQLAMEES